MMIKKRLFNKWNYNFAFYFAYLNKNNFKTHILIKTGYFKEFFKNISLIWNLVNKCDWRSVFKSLKLKIAITKFVHPLSGLFSSNVTRPLEIAKLNNILKQLRNSHIMWLGDNK